MIAVLAQLFFALVGVLLLPSYTLTGLVVLGLAVLLRPPGRSEDAFIALLMILGALGAALVVGQFIAAL